ncbi:MAG TPA: hypothetical protein VNK04_21985 [Gemmataceae bacterium]|nr:hypothetical protein [Gemmataceae bacterium]
MDSASRPSIWFYIGIASLTLALGPFFLGFVAILTWGLIFIPVVALTWFGPLLLLHWVLWGRAFSWQVSEGAEGVAGGVADALVKRPTVPLRVLRLAGGVIVIIGTVLYYLSLLGVFNASTEPRFLHIESRSDGTVWIRNVTLDK